MTRQASPGKLGEFEEDLFCEMKESAISASEMPTVVAIRVQLQEGQNIVGIAFCCQNSHTIKACEIVDDDHFCTLESILVQVGARECAVVREEFSDAASGVNGRNIQDVFVRCGVMTNERNKSEFSTKSLEIDLEKVVTSGYVEHYREVLDRKIASSAIAGLLSYMELLADAEQFQKWTVSLYDSNQYMRLDAAAMKALNVLRTKSDINDTFSIAGLLCRGRTHMGKRLVKTWLKQPLLKVEDIRTRHDIVEAFVSDIFLREGLRDQFLRGMPDIDRLVRKLEKKKINLMELCLLYRASGRLPLIEDALRAFKGKNADILHTRYADQLKVFHDDDHLAKFEELLEAAVDLDRVPDEFLISPQYSEDLLLLHKHKCTAENNIDTLAQDIADNLNLTLDKNIKLEWHRFNNNRNRCLRITSKEEKVVRKQLQAKYLILETRKDGTKFTNRAFKAAAEKLNQISVAYDSKQKELVEAVIGVAQSYVHVWQSVGRLIAEIDALAGFADVALCAAKPYTRPTMLETDSGSLKLIGSRHPCVEAQDGVDFIPNDCIMKKGESWFQIVTGPNMGGKSTFIRQVGAIVLMAQVGSFVPCDEAEISIRDAIFARVGAGDCQMRGVSTFMAEMLETAAILKGATSNSLIIIDELGRGTSTNDGFGLAWAISSHLMEEIGAPTLFATHFHEITKISGSVGVANLHVETGFQDGKLVMLYNIRPGTSDKSFGIAVAEKVNFPQEVIACAREYEHSLSKRIRIH